MAPTKWQPTPSPTREQRDACRVAFTLGNEVSLSLWAAPDQSWCELLIAAMMATRAANKHFMKPTVETVSVLEIDRDDILRFGPVTPTPGNGSSVVTIANRQHVDLEWEQAQLFELADHLAFVRLLQCRTVRPPQVKEFLKSLSVESIAVEYHQARSWLASIHAGN